MADETDSLPPLPPGATFVPDQSADLPPLPPGATFLPDPSFGRPLKEQVTSDIRYLTPETAPPAGRPQPPIELGGQRPAYDPDLSFYQNWKRGAHIPEFDITKPSTWDPAILKMPLEGGRTALHGVEQIADPNAKGTTPGQQLAGGVHQIFSGLSQAATPFVLPAALVANPIGTVAALGAGTAGGYAAQKGAEALGAKPEYAALAGDVGNVLAGASGASLASRAVLPKVSLTPEQAAAVQFADKQGIPLSTYARSGSEAVRKRQIAAGETKTAQESQAATQAALEQTGQALGSPTEIPETAGAGVAQALTAAKLQHAKAASASYDELGRIEQASQKPIVTSTRTVDTGLVDSQGQPITRQENITENIGLPADMQPVKTALVPLRDRLLKEMPLGQQQMSVGLKAISNLIDGPDILPASVADSNLSAVKAVMREASINDKTKFLVGQTLDALGPAVDQAVAAGGPDAVAALNEGRAFTRAKYATQNTMDNLPDEPVKLFQKLTTRGDANINLLRDVKTHAPGSLPAVGRALLEGVFDTAQGKTGTPNPKAALNAWNAVGDATKSIVYSPDQIRGVDNFLQLANLEAKTPRAGTGAVPPSFVGKITDPAAILGEILLGSSGHPTIMKGIIAAQLLRFGSRQLSKMFWDPRVARMLTTPYQLPPAAVGAAASGRGAAGYVDGGPVRELERRAFDRGVVLDHLGRRG